MMQRSLPYVFFLLLAFTAKAQNSFFYIAWDINKPLSTTDYIRATSLNGMKAGFRIFPGDGRKFSVGVDVNWGAYDEYAPRQTMQTGDGAITTDYFKYIYTLAGTINGQYYFTVGEGDRFYPYAGVGLGAINNQYAVFYNIYTEDDSRWGFLVRPEAGVIVRISRSMAAMAAIHYDWSNNNSEYFDYDNFSAAGFQLGLVFMNRR
jgi:hypothetical protein